MDLSPDEDNFQGRLLHQAALWDNVELLQELLSSGADVDALDSSRRSALHAAALAERSACLAALCRHGACVDAQSDAATGGKTALHIASERGHVENVKTLLSAGADTTILDANGDTALALAERASHRHAARALRQARDALERERQSQHAQLRELVSRGETHQLKAKLASLGKAAGLVVNLTPGGANTLLYVAAEAGLTSAVSALLDAGADGRAHPVTKYCPLYIACYHGHVEIAKMLLHHFPEAAQQETVEKWLPLHAACIGGHASLVTLLLEYPYPDSVCSTYTDPSGQWQYRSGLDVNARDASGQTALYVACTLGNVSVVDALLGHTVPCTRHIDQSEEPPPLDPPPQQVLSPHRAGISLGIHAIVSKLTGASSKTSEEPPPLDPPPQQVLSPHLAGISLGIHAIISKLTGASSKTEPESGHRIRPVLVDSCRSGDSCLGTAARAGHIAIVKRLLQAGAHPDSPAHPPDQDQTSGESRSRRRSRSACAGRAAASPSPCRGRSQERSCPWTALSLAAHARNVRLLELLLSHGATDVGGRALRECARHGLIDLVATLLATKAYPDPDYKLNKAMISESVFTKSREGDSMLTYNAICPATPVMVNWRELGCQLVQIRMSWLRSASLRVNSKLGSARGALLAITRIDLSNNDLRVLPPELFTLLSLRYLNAAQNKLERLPSPSDPFEDEVDSKGRKMKRKKNRPDVYTAPVLQEVYLQDNRLEEIPPALFSLPSLSTLDVSNNKLRSLPAAMWDAPHLRDLNAALNHLRDLPTGLESLEPSSPSQLMSQSDSSSQLSASPTVQAGTHFAFNSDKSWSRSPSIERSESEAMNEDDDNIPSLGNRAGNAVWSSARRVHSWRGVVEPVPQACPLSGSRLASLNLSHNQLTCVPASLACRAPALTRLNMAYNSLRSMSYVTSYPTSLRQLDLSHNEITCWPSLPQLDNLGSSEGDPLACYCRDAPSTRARPRSGGSARAQLLSAACAARRHLRLEGLRTLILANNMLTRIQLTTDDDGFAMTPHDGSTDDDDEWNGGSSIKSRLLFPLLSMLDVSCNLLKTIPPAIHELTNLAVFNISGNKEITDLPPQMGLLSRLWNLNTVGCSLNEPLRSMLSSGRYKSMDIVGYLKSVLQEARPYTRMKLMLTGVQGIGKTSLLECLRQESPIQYRRKPTEHWAKRMGNKSSRRNMSTVGVDIGLWVYEKQRSNRGPVTFRTWDFGGQQEYYATHQYFLSRRSLYLVVWKVTEGRKGLAHAITWLRSIQARAPGSPVIMVATHYDQVANVNLPENESPEALQRLIRSSIMGAPDADKLGLPRVMDSVEVSCSTKHNIRLLADIIYSIAFSVKPPGSKEPLLEQRIPATYLALEECVTSLASELKQPVLKHEEYKRLVTQYMQQKNHRMFRDAAELHQATMFLHENGVLLHYDDATLKELYFLNPQWLCDVLAHVVTVREINPFAQNGIMKIEDLAHVFKASPSLARGDEAGSLGLSLLNKFELALCWDARLLLVPPLLPATEPQIAQLPLRSRQWSSSSTGTPRRVFQQPQLSTQQTAAAGTESPSLVNEIPGKISLSGRSGGHPLRRLLLLSYVPVGFWARLCTRVLADSTLASAAVGLYTPPPETELDETLSKALELNWGWKLWKSGLKLTCDELTLVSLRELPATADADALLATPADDTEPDPLYQHLRVRVRQEGSWCTLDVSSTACVELLLPVQVCVVKREDAMPVAGYQSLSLEPNPEVLAKVLALVSDHVDLLLEDWYPSLGTRFVHTSEGRCLITRVVPCPACLRDIEANEPTAQQHAHDLHLAQAFRRMELGAAEPRRLRLSEESRASDGDSGVGAESNASSRIGSVEGVVNDPPPPVAYGWTVEECILAACTSKNLHCPHHPDVRLRDVAPDTLLLDVEEDKRARWDEITRGAIAGRGAFGTVLAAHWRKPLAPAAGVPVALKALQPVPPPPGADMQAQHAYKAALSRWSREPQSMACRAYCALRQELSVLLPLRHPHVARIVAVCAAPLALLLALAPKGALDAVLREYRGCSCMIGARAMRALALQVARALEYLHARRIVYRDLKSENVLVWTMPRPQDSLAAERSAAAIDVHVKLGDYGISRLAPPSGTKGFGGTEGFMAPEIMRYNGEEEYNEKVDCFSYGMLLYELVTLRQPFEGHEAVKEAVLDGARPSLSPRDLESPCCVLETMRRCWSNAPSQRPSAAALVAVAAAPEFVALQDAATAVARATGAPATAAAAAPLLALNEEGQGGWEIWYSSEPDRVHTLLTAGTSFTHHHTIRVPPDGDQTVTVTSMCRVGNKMWIGDSAGRIAVYAISTCQLLWKVVVQDAVGGAPSSVAAMHSLQTIQRVAVALSCGRLFLVTSSRPEAEGSFVLSELGAATELCCLTAVPTPHGFEIWSGGCGLCAYAVTGAGACDAEQIDAKPTVKLIAAAQEPYVVAYSDPGVCVYAWSVVSRRQSARLDCSKLAPCSESLQSIAIDEKLSTDWCKVTSLCCVGNLAYVGTAWGCVIVADAPTLRPLTVFRPYEHDVVSMVPLLPHKGTPHSAMLATLGTGYRPLLQRFAPNNQQTNHTTSHSGFHCLLWRAHHWLPD